MLLKRNNYFLFIHFFIFSLYINFNYITDLYSFGDKFIYQLAVFFFILALLFITNLLLFKSQILIDSTVISVLFFWFYVVLNVIYISPLKEDGIIKTIGLTFSIFLVFIPYLMDYKSDDFKIFIRIYLFILLLLVVLILIEVFFKSNINTLLSSRLWIGELNPIWSGRIFGEVIILLLLTMKKRFFKFIFIISLLIGMISSGSKGPLFSLILSLTLIYVVPFFLKKKFMLIELIKRYFSMVLLLIFGFLFIRYIVFNIFDANSIIERFLIIKSESSYGENARLTLFVAAWEFFKESPLFGNGFSSFSLMYGGFQSANYPHNILLESLSELGIIGFLFLVIPILITVLRYFKFRKIKYKDFTLNLLMALFLYYFFNSLVSGELGFYNNKLFLYMGLLNYYIVQLSKIKSDKFLK